MDSRQEDEKKQGKALAKAELERLKAEVHKIKLLEEYTEKALSLSLAGLYLLFAYFKMCDNTLDFIEIAGALTLPLACIWFSEQVGAYTGPTFSAGIIWRESHPDMIRLIGWIILLLPLILIAAISIRKVM